MQLIPAGQNTKAEATVLIHDQSGMPAVGATVYGDFYLDGEYIETDTELYGTTDGNGYAVITSPPRKAKSGQVFTFVTTDVVLTGYEFISGPYDEGSIVMP